MFRLFESIKLLNGEFRRLSFHQSRIDNSFKELFVKQPTWRLDQFLASVEFPVLGLYKCRVIYDEATVRAEFVAYEIKPIRTLKVVIDDEISYRHKFEGRGHLSNAWAMRGSCDDVLILQNGMVTDTLYANIVFERGGIWYTPTTYLLPGTMRQFLLSTGAIREVEISGKNIRDYNQFKLINSMMEWDGPEIDVSNIIFD